jgi:hypothetical protein
MPFIVKALLAFLSDVYVQRLILAGLSQAAQRTDNTIDNTVVAIVKAGLENRVNPIQRVTGK